MDDLTGRPRGEAPSPFEARLARGVALYTERAIRTYDPAAVTQAAARAARGPLATWAWPSSLRLLRLAVLALIVALVAGTALFALVIGGHRRIVADAPPIVYARDRSIIVLDPNTNAERPLGIGDDPVWSPDHDRIALGRGDEHVVFDLVDGSEVVLGPWFGPVVWSPDGSSVLAAYRTGPVDTDGSRDDEFTILPIDGGPPVGLGIEPWSDAGNGAWSPDGERVAVVTNGSVVVAAVSGRGSEVLHGGGSPWLVDWSSAADMITFSDERGIWVTDPDTGAERLAVGLPGLAQSLEWSPDGTKLAYVDRATLPAFVHDVRTGETREVLLPPDGQQAVAVTWSPAGDSLLITVAEGWDTIDMTASLWIVSADGARNQLLAQPAAYEPHWSHPDW